MPTNIICQVYSGNNHTYNPCPDVPDKKKEEIKEYRDCPRPHDGIKHECNHCGKHGHTESKCWDEYPDKAKCLRCGGKHRKKDCVKNSLGEQVKELLSERALDDAQLEKIADILQEKLTTRARQAEASSSRVVVARRG